MSVTLNDQIRKNLLTSKARWDQALAPYLSNNRLLKQIYEAFNGYDFSKYQSQAKEELAFNLVEWWTNQDRGIVQEEEVLAIILEYDGSDWGGREALAYGISTWDDFDENTDDFDMGYNYSFTSEFYAAPGLMLSYFDTMAFLDDDTNLNEEHKEGKYLYVDGFEELTDYINVSAAVHLQSVLQELENEKLFDSVNYVNNFLVAIGEHEMTKYPLLILNK